MRRISEYLLILYSLTGTISITVSQAIMGLGALVGLVHSARTFTRSAKPPWVSASASDL